MRFIRGIFLESMVILFHLEEDIKAYRQVLRNMFVFSMESLLSCVATES